MSKYVVVWVDSEQAHVFHVRPEKFDESTIWTPVHRVHKHPESGHAQPDDEKRFFQEILAALAGAAEILVVGPSTAKLELIRYASKRDAQLEARIVGVESV